MDIRVAAGGGPSSGPQPYPIVYGYVSSEQPAPVTFTDPVFVVIPSHNAETSIPLAWPAVHGATKPVANMPVVLAYDDRGVLSVLGWGDSSTAFAAPGGPPSGAAGGALSGNYPNPGLTQPVTVSGHSATIIDGSGQSSFLQLSSTERLLADVRTGTLTWAAATPFSQGTTLTLAGAVGTVNGIATPTAGIGNPGFFDYPASVLVTPGTGQVSVSTKTLAGGNPGTSGVMPFVCLLVGA